MGSTTTKTTTTTTAAAKLISELTFDLINSDRTTTTEQDTVSGIYLCQLRVISGNNSSSKNEKHHRKKKQQFAQRISLNSVVVERGEKKEEEEEAEENYDDDDFIFKLDFTRVKQNDDTTQTIIFKLNSIQHNKENSFPSSSFSSFQIAYSVV